MKRNVILLTSGLTGSSVLTGLISQAGFWTGESTFKKREYNTYENSELIELNLKLFKAAGYEGNYLLEFSREALEKIETLYGQIDDSVYKAFVAKCNQHRPWIWKDPRLWLTIRFWYQLLPHGDCRFIVLTRGSIQSWVSQTLRRQITTYRYSKQYESCIQRSIIEFFKKYTIPYVHMRYEHLIEHPAETISVINQHLDLSLTLDDLRNVYHKPLFKSPRTSLRNHVRALLIYVKNYSERLDVVLPK